MQKLEDIVQKAKKKGADAADAVCISASLEDIGVRNRALENIDYAESHDLGLRVILNGRQANVSFSDNDSICLDDIVDELMTKVKILPQDPYAIIAPNHKKIISELNLFDTTIQTSEKLLEDALELEDVALSHKGITQSLGASVSQVQKSFTLVNSFGFSGSYKRSSFAKSVSVLAGEGENMVRDYAYSQAVFLQDLKSSQAIGDEAASLTLQKLNPTTPKTAKLPIVFAPRMARRLLGIIASAINGGVIVKKSSFLLEQINQQILPEELSLIDCPLLEKGLASRPFDGEGKESQINKLIDNGILKTWLLDERSAFELGLKSTASAQRGVSSPHAGCTNLILEGQMQPTAELMKQNASGIYITEMMGNGINMLNGDISQGASGFIIDKDGRLGEPISNFTIAGKLPDMLKALQAGDDADTSYTIVTPTLSVSELIVAGQN
ncbi:MAG: TldD/PmbA family protein [Alphaproteobacteria bacterium]